MVNRRRFMKTAAQAAGSHLTVWNTTGRASGTYFYRFRFGGLTETRKMLLLK